MALRRLLKLGVKGGVAGGVVYYTIQEGVWKDSDEAAQLYQRIYVSLAPYVQKSPVEVPELPKLDEMTYTAQNYWNKGVKLSCTFLTKLPGYAIDWGKTGTATVVQLLVPSESDGDKKKVKQ